MSDNSVKLIETIGLSVQALIEKSRKLSEERDNAIKDQQLLQSKLDSTLCELNELSESVDSLKKDRLRLNEIEKKKKEINEKIKLILVKLEKLDRTIFTDDARESSL